ncbi:MAG TPA: hypothetical protein PLY70_11820 [Saprospiraceae bacterium]|nr:hypothetical protein [Saprospiraceae bacterium]HPN70965.1 hypothetical protein [Saprospiraceae bacterium]
MFDKLKKLFVVEDGSAASSSPTSSGVESMPSTENVSGPSVSKTPEMTIEVNAAEGTPDQKFIDILLKSVEKNNMDGFDYLEYKQSLQSLANMAMDDATRYNSALAMAKTMGASKETILSSAGHYLGILKQEEEKFKAALVGQKSMVEQNQTVGISNLEKSIVQKQQQVESLLKQIEEDKARLEQMKNEISEAASKIQATANNFMSAYNLVVGQIVEDVDNIKNFAK